MACVSLVVMEPGSEWPGHVGESETLVALRSEQDMLRCTRERVASLHRAHEEVRVAVLACNGATDEATLHRRASLAQELLACVSRAWRGRLVLTAPGGRASGVFRHHLLSLAGCQGLRVVEDVPGLRQPLKSSNALGELFDLGVSHCSVSLG